LLRQHPDRSATSRQTDKEHDPASLKCRSEHTPDSPGRAVAARRIWRELWAAPAISVLWNDGGDGRARGSASPTGSRPMAVVDALTSFRRFPRAREGRGGSGPIWVEPPPFSFCQILFDRIAY